MNLCKRPAFTTDGEPASLSRNVFVDIVHSLENPFCVAYEVVIREGYHIEGRRAQYRQKKAIWQKDDPYNFARLALRWYSLMEELEKTVVIKDWEPGSSLLRLARTAKKS